MTIGITGQIGAGKSSAASILAQLGAAVVDADLIGRQVVEQNRVLLNKLTREFGPTILSPTGQLRRKELARLAFVDEDGKRELDQLVHPYLLKELRRQIRELSKQYDVVVVDAALLLDWQLDRELDFVLVIHASQSIRTRRMLARGYSADDVLSRQNHQLAYSEYRRRADRVIFNGGTKYDLRKKLVRLWAGVA